MLTHHQMVVGLVVRRKSMRTKIAETRMQIWTPRVWDEDPM